MNKTICFLSLAAVLLTACEKGLDDIEGSGVSGQVTNSLLQVRTRGAAAGSEATVSYPVAVYVFSGDECKAAQTIGDEGQTLNIALTEGTYSVFAVGGASSTDYVLPVASDALTTSAIALREGKSHGDLMAAKATVTLADGEANTVTLGMERKVMLLQSMVLKKIPTAATAVSMSMSPLWQSLTVGGNYSGTDGSYSVALEKQSDGRTWQLPAPVGEGPGVGSLLLPPSSSPASITVRITTPSGTRSYTYSTSNELEAAYKINIDGTYTEAVGVNLTGTITGATWLGERTISFEFDENGSSATENTENTENSGNAVPSVGDTYQGCYVLAVNDEDDYAEVTLLSPTELEFYDANATTMQANIDAALASVTSGDISGWEVPTTAEASMMYDAREAIGNLTAGTYLCHGGTGYRAFKPSDAAFSTSSSNVKASTVLRPVVTITINKE